MGKKELADQIIANKDSGWAEDERPALEGLSEKRLTQMIEELKKPVVNTTTTTTTAAPAATTCGCQTGNTTAANIGAPAAKANEPAPILKPEPKAMTKEEYIANAPPEIRQLLEASLAAQQQQQAQLIGVIMANQNNKFTKEFLEKQSTEFLNGLVALAQTNESAQSSKPVPMYLGAGGVSTVENQNKEEALELPTINQFFPPAKSDKQIAGAA